MAERPATGAVESRSHTKARYLQVECFFETEYRRAIQRAQQQEQTPPRKEGWKTRSLRDEGKDAGTVQGLRKLQHRRCTQHAWTWLCGWDGPVVARSTSFWEVRGLALLLAALACRTGPREPLPRPIKHLGFNDLYPSRSDTLLIRPRLVSLHSARSLGPSSPSGPYSSVLCPMVAWTAGRGGIGRLIGPSTRP
ncbi:hypothetical protein VTK73DRAFT_4343 [Phialemonium thermophilum]|uniref:Uncharacterized protein n=1 Tax=Phialemonium thermophilum TaxID=223376 RepID=A0ABR3V9J1_9PEZI